MVEGDSFKDFKDFWDKAAAREEERERNKQQSYVQEEVKATLEEEKEEKKELHKEQPLLPHNKDVAQEEENEEEDDAATEAAREEHVVWGTNPLYEAMQEEEVGAKDAQVIWYTNVLYDALHEEDHNQEKHQPEDYATAWAAKRLNEAARNQHVDAMQPEIKEEKQQKDNNEQQSPPSMDTTNQIIIVDLLKPLPYYLSTDQIYIYILGEIKARGKWLRKTTIPWSHALRERRSKSEVVHKRAHGDGVPFNIKVYPP